MHSGLGKLFFAGVLSASILVGSCAPSLQEIGKRKGCDKAAQNLAFYAEKRIRRARFLEESKRRAALAPLTLVLGVVANYLLQAVYVLPAIAPEGFKLKKKRLGAIGLERALHYTSITGTRLERLEDKAIARTIFDVAMCYYSNREWPKAVVYFEKLRGSVYRLHIGRAKLLLLLGNCYYMMEKDEKALECYREFLQVAPSNHPRSGPVRNRIEEVRVYGKYKND